MPNTQQIVKVTDIDQPDLACRAIYGLNIFAANGVHVSTAEDPRIIFLNSLSEQKASSAFVGYLSLKDLVDDPAELFGQGNAGVTYHRIRLGLYAGTFYDIDVYPTDDGCFFPVVSGAFWQSVAHDGYSDIRSILQHDALSLFVDKAIGAEAKFDGSLFPGFSGEAQWLQFLTSIYSLVVVSGGDGMDFTVYSQNVEKFIVIDEAVVIATEAISSSKWYDEHQNQLAWDDEYAGCLKIIE